MNLSAPQLQALREQAAQLPDSPGVYTFHGEREGIPLYIGKSVHLRQRVLAHLRNPDEVRMLRQTWRISHRCTAGEIGALLLEAQFIKAQQPLFNQRLRRTRQLCALRWQAGAVEVVDARSVDFAQEAGLFGLFPSRMAALEGLRTLADAHGLCDRALGLERGAAGRPCFRFSVGRCRGWCHGLESTPEHDSRLAEALRDLRIVCWPFAGAVGLVEGTGRERQIHVLRNWCYLGSAGNRRGALGLSRVAAHFDADGYRIASKALLSGSAPLLDLSTGRACRALDGPREG